MFSLGQGPRSGFRPLVTAVVVGVWLVLMGFLLWDRYGPTVAEVADKIEFSAAETDDWFLIRIRGAYAGFGRSRQFRKGSNWRLRDDLQISLNLQGQVKPIRIVSESDVDAEFRLISFRLKVSSGLISFQHKGHMQGRDLVLETPGYQGGGKKTLKLFQRPRISRSLGLPLPLTGLEVDQEIKIPIFDPMDGRKADAVIKVLERADLLISGDKIASWRVRAIFRSVDLTMWIDDQGRLLKGRMPLGITVIRSDRNEIAEAMKGGRDLPEFISLASVPVEGHIPAGPDLERVSLKIQGAEDWSIPDDGYRQKSFDSRLTITREDIPQATYQLPCKDPGKEQFLKSSPFVLSDNPEIVSTARRIVGEEKDPVKAAQLINRWVFKYLKKVPTPSVPNAHTVLLRKQGDCNEHAVLAAALARAVGLPTRMEVGIVYSGDGFYYHAWVSYWVGKHWLTGDPLMNQLPIDPTHVTLVYGDVDKHVNVISFLGRLKLKVLGTKTTGSG